MKIRIVRCASCHTHHGDRGKGQTCVVCGCSPLPSYDYDKTSTFHPLNCHCAVGKQVLRRERITPIPTLNFLKDDDCENF
jgi:hypothetical protein